MILLEVHPPPRYKMADDAYCRTLTSSGCDEVSSWALWWAGACDRSGSSITSMAQMAGDAYCRTSGEVSSWPLWWAGTLECR